MVEFIVRQCSLNPDDKALNKLASEEVSPIALRDMSSKTLQLITTTIDNMDQVLWPFLMEFIVPPAYTNGLSIVCRCVADIATEKRQSNADDYDLNYEELGIVQMPPYSVCICMCVYSEPS